MERRLLRLSRGSLFGPCVSRRERASSAVRPLSALPSRCRTTSLAESAKGGCTSSFGTRDILRVVFSTTVCPTRGATIRPMPASQSCLHAIASPKSSICQGVLWLIRQTVFSLQALTLNYIQTNADGHRERQQKDRI